MGCWRDFQVIWKTVARAYDPEYILHNMGLYIREWEGCKMWEGCKRCEGCTRREGWKRGEWRYQEPCLKLPRLMPLSRPDFTQRPSP